MSFIISNNGNLKWQYAHFLSKCDCCISVISHSDFSVLWNSALRTLDSALEFSDAAEILGCHWMLWNLAQYVSYIRYGQTYHGIIQTAADNAKCCYRNASLPWKIVGSSYDTLQTDIQWIIGKCMLFFTWKTSTFIYVIIVVIIHFHCVHLLFSEMMHPSPLSLDHVLVYSISMALTTLAEVNSLQCYRI